MHADERDAKPQNVSSLVQEVSRMKFKATSKEHWPSILWHNVKEKRADTVRGVYSFFLKNVLHYHVLVSYRPDNQASKVIQCALKTI